MRYDPTFGPAAPDSGCIPAPRYLMRRARILALMRDAQPKTLVEIGCDGGLLLHEFAAKGFQCIGIEASAAFTLASVLGNGIPSISFRCQPDASWTQCFDTAFSFDVLEHIENDARALHTWASWLRPGGQLLLSVPASETLWTAGDDFASGYLAMAERT